MSVVERWRGATMSGRVKGQGIDTSEFDDLEALAGQEFGRVRPALDSVPPLAPAAPPAQPVAGPRPGAMTPDSFYFPVEPAPRQPFSKLRK